MSTAKPSNPKEAFGILKAYFSVLPLPAIYEVAVGMLEGAFKYGRHNWRVVGVKGSTYYDAAKRHLDLWWEGEDIDPDSGLPHLVKAICCLLVARDAQIFGKFEDDRPPRAPQGWMNTIHDRVKELVLKYPTPKEPMTWNGDTKSAHDTQETFRQKYEEIKERDAEERSNRGMPKIGLGR